MNLPKLASGWDSINLIPDYAHKKRLVSNKKDINARILDYVSNLGIQQAIG